MKKKWLLLIPLFAVTLCGCSFIKRLIFGDESTTQAISYNLSLPEPQVDHGDGYDKYNSFSYNLREVLNTTGQYPLKSTGTQKVLVIPVQFTGSAYRWTTYERDSIRKCFFGNPSSNPDLGWESVSSFYNKSSYGKLEISGELGETFTSKYTFAELDSALHPHPDRDLVDEFEKSTTYNTLRKKYDTDGDGFIDSIAFIYRDPIKVDSEMRWWAFVYTNNSEPNAEKPMVNTYMWASYYFQDIASSGNPHGGKYNLDAHTYIHESGHLLGLDDYYCYPDNAYDPSGGQEMHSQNIGDENIYSKLCLNWVAPYHVKTSGSVTLTLRTSSAYGDAIIINDNWNGTPMDEYLILEYYSPTVLNQKDSESAYAKNAQMFQTSGFRLYHVDSRLVAYNKVGEAGYAKRLDWIDPTYYNFVGASNTPAYPYSRLNDTTEMKNFKLLHLMQAGGVNTFKTKGDKAVDSDLFKQGSSFVANANFFAKGSKFNAGNEVGYRISFGTCEPTQGTVTITKL